MPLLSTSPCAQRSRPDPASIYQRSPYIPGTLLYSPSCSTNAFVTLHPKSLPVELFSHILSFLDNHTLASISPTNSFFRYEVDFHIYTAATLKSQTQFSQFVSAVATNEWRCSRVRSLTMKNITIDRINELLLRLPSLIDLEISSSRNIKGFRPFTPTKFPFKLQRLCCDIDPTLHDAFLEFLSTQPHITELDIVITKPLNFHLPSNALPNLRALRCPISHIQIFVPGRPVTHIEIQGFLCDSWSLRRCSVTALKLSSGPLISFKGSLTSRCKNIIATELPRVKCINEVVR